MRLTGRRQHNVITCPLVSCLPSVSHINAVPRPASLDSSLDSGADYLHDGGQKNTFNSVDDGWEVHTKAGILGLQDQGK